jgi:hypothetical protein
MKTAVVHPEEAGGKIIKRNFKQLFMSLVGIYWTLSLWHAV